MENVNCKMWRMLIVKDARDPTPVLGIALPMCDHGQII